MTTYGPAIQRGVSALWPEDRDRPVGVRDGDMVLVGTSIEPAVNWSWDEGGGYSFADTHPLSIAETWNQAHPGVYPFDRIWRGGDSAPDDWDGGDVLLRDSDGEGCGVEWSHDGTEFDIIAYRSRPASVTFDPDGGQATYNPETHGVYDRRTHVAVDKIGAEHTHDWTSVEWAVWAREIGIIRPEPTRAERIASETGLTVDQVQAVLDASNE